MVARVVAVTVEILEELSGVWCAACALPSARSVSLAVTVAIRTTLTTYSRCMDCGATF